MITYIRERLFALQDKGYKEFHSKLVPDMNKNTIIGVRTPGLRKLAKELAKDERIGAFINVLPHMYYEEMNLHGFIISEEKDYDRCVHEIDRMLPYIDNWATCDLLSPKAFKQKKNRQRLLKDIQRWMSSKEPFTIRFGIVMLMSHFLDDDFMAEHLKWVAEIRHDNYYVKMAVAWYFATALAKQWDASLPYFEGQTMDVWVHNKGIQKAVESFRVTDEHKDRLRKLKR